MFWLLIVIIAFLIYWFLIKPYNYWLGKGVKQANPKPFFGDNWSIVTGAKSFVEMLQDIYNTHPNTRYMGMYQMLTPTLIVRDPELIKQITVKEFDHFVNHRGFETNKNDPLWSRNLVVLKDQQWREMRAILSPTFTSNKMRQMFELMTQTAEQFIQHFLKKNENIVTIELKDMFTRYTNDVIASAAFGIKCDSLEEPNNEFYLMGKKATNFSGFWKSMKLFGYFIFPKLYKLLDIQVYPKDVGDFFVNLIKQNIKQREEQGIVRTDMIQLLLEARKNSGRHEEDTTNSKHDGFATVEESDIIKSTIINREITDIDITSHAFVFFFAGFESVATIMSFMGYELGANPEIQERLHQEINKTFDECKGQLTYEALMKMKYMDMVVSETLRKWPNAAIADRICTKPFTIEPVRSDEQPVHLNIGDSVYIPIFGLHRDPEYYPEPDRFDPERFNDENKYKIKPYTYLPFGAGPRNCIGSRFALLEIKTLFFYILKNFEIVPIEKTQIPVKICRKSLAMTAENGFWFGLQRRDN